MDPLSIGLSAVSLGMQVFGGISAASEARRSHEIQNQISGLETQVNGQRRDAMELSSRRQLLENFRNTQRARAMGLNASVNQGAQFGTGLQGGQAQATDQGLFNGAGINQNTQIGRNIFGLNDQISGLKAQLSNSQSAMSTDQSISGFGSMLGKNVGTLGNIFQGFGSSGSSNPYYGPLDYNGK